MQSTVYVPKYDKIRALAVEQTSKRFGVTKEYVRMIYAGKANNTEIKEFCIKLYEDLTIVANS